MKSSPLLLALLCVTPLFAGAPVKIEKPAARPPTPLPPVISPAAEADKLLPLVIRPPAADAPPSLLPDEIPPAPVRPTFPKAPDAKKPSSTFRSPETAADLDQRIRYRKARNIAESDPKVRAAWEDSRDAKNDSAKRQALKRYYDALFGKMLALDKGIAPLIEQRREPKDAALEQRQITPAVPLP